jgi:hypothetical protein
VFIPCFYITVTAISSEEGHNIGIWYLVFQYETVVTRTLLRIRPDGYGERRPLIDY